MHYFPPAEAAGMSGLRLVLTRDSPGPWGEAAKSLFHVRGVPFIPVAQLPFEANEDLVAWTGVRNAPVAVYDDEPPRASWLDILMLAQRLGSGPELLPEDSAARAEVIGIAHEICGEWGLGWCRRLIILDELWKADLDLANEADPRTGICRTYGFTPETAAMAPRRISAILQMLCNRLEHQKAKGSRYLVGDSLTAADVYWASFSIMFDPLPPELNPMPDFLRALYSNCGPEVAGALRPDLNAHRDYIYQTHLRLPLEF